MRMIDLFSGIGGFSLAASWVWGDDLEIVCFCEINPFCRLVLKKHWPTIPIVEDVNDLDRIVAYANQQRGDSTRPQLEGWTVLVEADQSKQEYGSDNRTSGKIDLLTGGVPCQPSSCAGKRRGTKDNRWLWPQALAVVDAIEPRWVIFENPTGFLTLDGGVEYLKVLAHLEAQGYWTESFIIPASAVGAPHRRDRVWIIAESNAVGCGRRPDHQGEQADGGNGDQKATTLHPEIKPIGTGLCPSGQTGKRRKRPGNADSDDSNADRSMLEVWSETEGERTCPAARRVCGPAPNPWDEHWYAAATRLCRVDDGLSRKMDGVGILPSQAKNKSKAAGRVHRIKALGNSIVPQVAEQIMRAIKGVTNAS